MKALTVQQPWAWAIIHGGKNIENRTQAVRYRGPVAIHAGARWSERGAAIVPRLAGPWQQGWHDRVDRVPLGVVIGVVDLVDCHPAAHCCEPWGEQEYVEHGGRLRTDVVHWVLENPRPVAEPYPVAGHLGLWNLKADVGGLVAGK